MANYPDIRGLHDEGPPLKILPLLVVDTMSEFRQLIDDNQRAIAKAFNVFRTPSQKE